MTPEVLNQALDPFFTTKEVGQGTGLGLPMVFGIVQGHQGYLTIDSDAGRGHVRAPVPAAPARRADGGAGRAAVETRQVVEPESDAGPVDPGRSTTRRRCSTWCAASWRSPATASPASRAGRRRWTSCSSGRPVDLVILDLMMPREDAATTFQRLRQQRPGVPVLLCTGLPQADPPPTCCAARRVADPQAVPHERAVVRRPPGDGARPGPLTAPGKPLRPGGTRRLQPTPRPGRLRGPRSRYSAAKKTLRLPRRCGTAARALLFIRLV